jgi:hypothetical protein
LATLSCWDHYHSYFAFVIVYLRIVWQKFLSFTSEDGSTLTNKEVFGGTFRIIFSIMTKEKMVTENQF